MPADPQPVNDYGSGYPFHSQLEADKWAFTWRVEAPGMPRRVHLFQRIAESMMPGHFEWHPWTVRVIEALCSVDGRRDGKSMRLVAFPGAAGSAKTFNVAGFACVWWLCLPGESGVTSVSTTVKSLRRRGWAEVQKCYDAVHAQGWDSEELGNFVDSRMVWQSKLGDDKNAVVGRAVEEGAVHKVADDIKGIHNRRQMVIIDEATSVPEAIYEACANLHAYPEEFILVCIGNPRNRLDAFGRFCEPDKGWTSVSVDTGEWEAKPMEACGGAKPLVLTFDAEKSPNITEGKEVSRHLPSAKSVLAARRTSGGQTPYYWQNFRGFWPPESLGKNVFSESAIQMFNGMGAHKFTGEHFRIIGAFDPAYTTGGDRAALRFAKMGEIAEMPGYWGIELMPPIIIPVNAYSTNPVHYQLAEQLRRECEKVMVGTHAMSCPPENLCIDDTGSGGLGDVIYRTWSPRVHRIEFGGKPAEEPCSIEDVRPANEVYKNKRAEMFFRLRGILDAGQLRGIDGETALELVSIEFDDSKTRIVLISKMEYKAKFGKSPDLADCAAMIAEMARIKGFRLAALGQTEKAERAEDEAFKVNQAMYENTDYVEEERPEDTVPSSDPIGWGQVPSLL